MITVSAGVPELDRFLGGYQPGDNVVWAVESGTFLHTFVGAFIQESARDPESAVVYVNSNYAPQTIQRRFAELAPGSRFVHVDAFTYGKGKGDSVFRSHYESADLPDNFESLLTRAGFGMSSPPTIWTVNGYNQDKRFARAFLNEDGDPIIEADLDVDGGVTDETIKRFLLRFILSVDSFASWIGYQ